MAIIVITGVTNGLGKAMVQEFANRGHVVAGCGRSSEHIESMQTEFGSAHSFSVVDVSSDAAIAEWATRVLSEFGAPDYLINNAAIINRNALLWEISANEFNELTAINVNGIANTIRHFVPAMISRGAGTIVNFSSGWGRSVSAKVAPYCATKWAVEGLTQALAEELPAPLIAVPLNPGIINTSMLQSCLGNGASSFPDAKQWAAVAVPFILNIQHRESGRPLSVPDF